MKLQVAIDRTDLETAEAMIEETSRPAMRALTSSGKHMRPEEIFRQSWDFLP